MNHSSDAGGPGRGVGKREGKGREGQREGRGQSERREGDGEREGKGEGERLLSHGIVDHNFFLPWHLKQEV